jgi:hypothetical protein
MNRGQRFDDSGRYRVTFKGLKQPGCYTQDRAAAQALMRTMKWWRKDNSHYEMPVQGAILLCQPGEPDVLISSYTMFENGRIIRVTAATGRRSTCDWGDEK